MNKQSINIGKLAEKATSDAFRHARTTHIPLILKEGDYLVELLPDGTKVTIKHMPKSKNKLSRHFKLAR